MAESPRERRPVRPKSIYAHTDEELDLVVQHAVSYCAARGIDFNRLLHGVDAYMERRRRRTQRAEEKAMTEAYNDVMSDPWGNS